MKELKAKVDFNNENVEDMTKVQVLVSGAGYYFRSGSIEIVKGIDGVMYLLFDTSDGEYGPLGVSLDEFYLMLDKHVNKEE